MLLRFTDKYWDSQSPALHSPFIGCRATETANQREVQNNYCLEPDFGVPDFVLLKLCYLSLGPIYQAGESIFPLTSRCISSNPFFKLEIFSSIMEICKSIK